MENLVKGLKVESTILNKLANDVKFAEAVNKYAAKVVEINAADYKTKHGKDITEEVAQRWLGFAVNDITFKAFEVSYNYLLDTDEIEVIRTSNQNGAIELEAIVTRNGEVIDFNTEIILAGGYNIQKLHTRYIVKSKLSKTGNSVNAIVKKYNAIERAEQEIRYAQSALDFAQDELDNNEKLNGRQKSMRRAEIKKAQARVEKWTATLENLKAN